MNDVARTHQLHMYEQGHWEDVAHILFRDALRSDPSLAREYEALKRELAREHAADVEAYAEAKSVFVRAVISRARRDSKAPITIVDYHEDWPAEYEAEKTRLLAQIGGLAVEIEHVGSTSVPGLAAKPIIDIMPGVRTMADAEKCIEGMRRLGYEYVPEFEDAFPERRYFRKGHPEQHLHVHVVETTSAFWRRHTAFRDYLRAHPETGGWCRSAAGGTCRCGSRGRGRTGEFMWRRRRRGSWGSSRRWRMPCRHRLGERFLMRSHQLP